MNKPTKKHIKTFAFIDSQNLNMGIATSFKRRKIKYAGWKLDFVKFRKFLSDKYRVDTAFIFIGNLPGNEALYESLQRAGYILVLKPTTTYKEKDGSIKVKGNVDTDLVLYAAAKEIDNYDKAIIISGDGDFLSLYEYLHEKNKLGKIVIPNKLNYSQLLNKYSEYFDFVSVNKQKLEKRQQKRRV
jgi:uncharacterized LabA/DUF88 family protein